VLRDGHPKLSPQGAKAAFREREVRALPANLVTKLSDMLAAVDAANDVEDVVLFPGWRLHPLKGDLAGFWSLTVSGNWRMIFRFDEGDAFDLDLVDYH
jgi:proteic killer suppression protein